MLLRHAFLAAFLALIPVSCAPQFESDLPKVAARYGLDYDQMLSRARRTHEGLRGYFLLVEIVDGGPAEEYSGELAKLLEFWGEPAFLKAVESVVPVLRRQVLGSLAYEGGYGENERAWREFSAAYPRIAACIAREMPEDRNP